MSEWILILIIYKAGGASASFANQQACEAAKVAALQDAKARSARPEIAICVQRNGK
jgi:hypothetical protein